MSTNFAADRQPVEPGPVDGQRAEATLREQRELLRVTLASIGDAVITTDTTGRITFLNGAAHSLTGWTQEEAAGLPLENVFTIVSEKDGQAVESPAARASREGVVVGLANHTLLVARDGTQRPIDDSAAPIRNAAGEVAGVVLVFRDVSERRDHERALQEALQYAEDIIATLREPLLVFDKDNCLPPERLELDANLKVYGDAVAVDPKYKAEVEKAISGGK